MYSSFCLPLLLATTPVVAVYDKTFKGSDVLKPSQKEQDYIDFIVKKIANLPVFAQPRVEAQCKNTNSNHCCALAYQAEAKALLRTIPSYIDNDSDFVLWSSDAEDEDDVPDRWHSNTHGQTRVRHKCNLRYRPGQSQLREEVTFKTLTSKDQLHLMCELPFARDIMNVQVFRYDQRRFKQAVCENISTSINAQFDKMGHHLRLVSTPVESTQVCIDLPMNFNQVDFHDSQGN